MGTDHFSTPLARMISNLKSHREAQQKSPLLLRETEHDADLVYYRGSGEGFSGWQQVLDPTYYQRPSEQRLAVAKSLMQTICNGYDVIRRALSLESLPFRALDLKSLDRDFLNVVALHVSGVPATYLHLSSVEKMCDGKSPNDIQLGVEESNGLLRLATLPSTHRAAYFKSSQHRIPWRYTVPGAYPKAIHLSSQPTW